MASILSLIIFSACLYYTDSWTIKNLRIARSRASSQSAQILILGAKKVPKDSSKGFKNSVREDPKLVSPDVTELKEIDLPSTSIEDDADKIFKKYGIKSDNTVVPKENFSSKKSDGFSGKDRPFGESVIEKFPMKMQQQIDSILVTVTFLALLFVILCGVSISVGAYKIISPSFQVNADLDNLLTNFFSPAFTPSLIFFLFCSVTFGLFKFAQISNSQTVYKE